MQKYRWTSPKIHDHFDGTNRVEVKQGDIIELSVEMAEFLKDRVVALVVEEAQQLVSGEVSNGEENETETEPNAEAETVLEEAEAPRKYKR